MPDREFKYTNFKSGWIDVYTAPFVLLGLIELGSRKGQSCNLKKQVNNIYTFNKSKQII